MKKHVFGRKLKRDANERKALFKNLLTSLVLSERIKTTEAKAKAVKGAADKLVTKAKKGEAGARIIHPYVNQEAVVKLIKNIAPRFANVNGGYTRIIRIGKRRVADNAQMVYLEWSIRDEKPELTEAKSVKSKKPNKAKKSQALKSVSKKEDKAQVKTKIEKPVAIKKENKAQKPGFLKQLITRQKKG